jgi:hypothetical protein
MYAGVLCIHMLLALAHMAVLVCTRASSTAWSSIEGLVVLAYKSALLSRAFRGCSSGIKNSKMMSKQVRVGARVLDDGRVQAELVVCGSDDAAGDIIPRRCYS